MLRLISCLALSAAALIPSADARDPILRAVDLNIGETATVTLSDGSEVAVKLIALDEKRDSVIEAVREAKVTVEVDGKPIDLISATYHLPQTIGKVQIDCPVTKGHNVEKGYNAKGEAGYWGLEKDARLRLWPARSPWIAPGTFLYPVKQRWFASDTQMANEPIHVDGVVRPHDPSIFYHGALDIGGSEGLVDVVAVADGLVVSAKTFTLPEYLVGTPVRPRYDVLYLLDDRGWYHRYSHLTEMAIGIKPGVRVKMGDPIGILGKEGGSGGYTHLHFEIKSRQPSGAWGTGDGYAFLWEAYREEYKPDIIAVARPHQLIWTGETVTLDGSKSMAFDGEIASYKWQFEDGTTAKGPRVDRTYNSPGRHSETFKVTDSNGNVAYDFAVVVVYDRDHPDRHVNTIHPNYAPTFDIRAGDPVTFKVRTFIRFGSREGKEIWDFGDGSPKVEVQSDGTAEKFAPHGYAETVHRFEKPGDYIVRVERTDENGVRAAGNLWVHVGP